MKVLIFLMIILFSLSIADKLSLDQEISQMKQAPAEKRFELMNRIKKRIAAMNGAARAEAVSKLVNAHKHQEGVAGPHEHPQRIGTQPHLPNISSPGPMINQQIGKPKPRPQVHQQMNRK